MIKTLHISLVLISFLSFIGRVAVLQINPAVLRNRWLKILPHVIDTLLLLSGIALVIQSSWIASNPDWLITKIFALIIYIGLGIIVMHQQGNRRWFAFAGAIICYAYIFSVAMTKHALPW